VAKCRGVVGICCGVVAKCRGVVGICCGVVTKCCGVVGICCGVVAKCCGVVPKCCGVVALRNHRIILSLLHKYGLVLWLILLCLFFRCSSLFFYRR
jgi:hypothetical protein